ncbi:MAG: hypothetical protein LBI87_00505, partial [Candidatus Accumulibacter sp.]|nr:hypothetical protein [Accumulibacter sp.]
MLSMVFPPCRKTVLKNLKVAGGGFHRKTDSGLKPRPLGRCEGWNPGLEGRGFDRSYLGGVQT